MAKPDRTHFFWVVPSEGSPEDMRQLVSGLDEDLEDKHFSQGLTNFRATEFVWDEDSGAFTATVFKVREQGLPSALDDEDGATPLPIDDDTSLGEPMVFAYFPDYEAVIVQYNHNGPRHTTVANVLNQLGHPTPIYISPIINDETLDRLDDVNVFRTLEYSMKSPKQRSELKAVDASVGKALDLMAELGGVNLSVKVTMGHEKGSLKRIKSIAKKLVDFGDTDVGTLKVNARVNDETAMEHLDLLKARIESPFNAVMNGRELDRDDCRIKLIALFESRQEEIEAQQQAEEDDE